jgi:hypothetical protein
MSLRAELCVGDFVRVLSYCGGDALSSDRSAQVEGIIDIRDDRQIGMLVLVTNRANAWSVNDTYCIAKFTGEGKSGWKWSWRIVRGVRGERRSWLLRQYMLRQV